MKRRLVPFADTSVGFTIRFIIVHSSVALDIELRGGRCLSYVGREGRTFKVAPGKGSPEPVTHCPYCNHEGNGCWWTKEQARYMSSFAANKVVGPQLDDMARRFNRRAGSNDLIKMSIDVTKPEVPPAPEERDDMPASITFSCCGETIRYDGAISQLHCPICGQMQAA